MKGYSLKTLKIELEIKLVGLNKLYPHEKTMPERVEYLKEKILKDNIFTDPIIVDKKSFVILDGMHRVLALKKLNFNCIPVCLLDYGNKNIQVKNWDGSNIQIHKKDVLENAKRGILFPPKTTRHIIPYRPLFVNLPLSVINDESLTLFEKNNYLIKTLETKRYTLKKGPIKINDGIEDRLYEEDVIIFKN